MLCLHPEGLKLLLDSQALECFVKISLKPPAYKSIVMKPLGGDRMFQLRQLTHSLVNENKEISDRFLAQLLENLKLLNEKAWALNNEYNRLEIHDEDLSSE